MVITYLLSAAFLIVSTLLRYIRVDENHYGIRRFLDAFRFRDPRQKSQDVGMMIIQYISVMMFLVAPAISGLEELFQNHTIASELLQFLGAFIFPIFLLGTIKFFDVFYWTKKRDE